ncbi:MAG: DUF2752 domain-containing protein [Lachnospirales bacterium]
MKTYRKILISLIPILIALIIFVKININEIVALIPKCPYYSLFHIYCPGCGSTRAVMSLLKGDFILSLRCNPAIIIGIIIISIIYLELIFNKKILSKNKIFWIVFSIILILFYILRNFIPILEIPI